MKQLHIDLRARMVQTCILQQDVADEMGYDHGYLSRIMHGRVNTPDGFEERANIALDKLARAEQAAQEARERVLDEKDG